MIIDNPHIMRGIIRQYQPRFTHPGAEEIHTVLSDDLDAYARSYAELADRVWKREYPDKAGVEAGNEQPRDQLCDSMFMGS